MVEIAEEVKEAEVVKEEVAQDVPLEVAPEEVKEAAGPFIGGEVRIFADAKNGAINVTAPPNLVVALGLIEVGKAILIDMQQENMKKEPKIKSATVADLRALAGKQH